MEQITVKNILEATGGQLLCGEENLPIHHLSIDSRTMKGQDLFIPLIGERADAHAFISQAFENGAAAVLTSRHEKMEDSHPWILVKDTKEALQAIGACYRRRLPIPLVGITGSVGKTTTREMVAAALTAGFSVYKTPANHNSQVGVPLTLSEIDSGFEIGVIELGMSEPGELTKIAKIASIQMALITNVGVTHIEQLGSQENIYREKLSIQDGLSENGILLLNGDDELLKKTTARPGFRTLYYGTGLNCDYRGEEITTKDGYPVFTAVHGNKRVSVALRVMGSHNVLNALAALAVANEWGIPMEKAAVPLGDFTGFDNRQQIYERSGITFIDDTYNASPISMRAGIEVLRSMENPGRKLAVLADMKELGTDSPRFHREIGAYLGEHPVDILLTLGELGKEIAAGLEEREGHITEIHTFEEKAPLIRCLAKTMKQGDCVLFKGSNSMNLGEVAALFLAPDR